MTEQLEHLKRVYDSTRTDLEKSGRVLNPLTDIGYRYTVALESELQSEHERCIRYGEALERIHYNIANGLMGLTEVFYVAQSALDPDQQKKGAADA